MFRVFQSGCICAAQHILKQNRSVHALWCDSLLQVPEFYLKVHGPWHLETRAIIKVTIPITDLYPQLKYFSIVLTQSHAPASNPAAP